MISVNEAKTLVRKAIEKEGGLTDTDHSTHSLMAMIDERTIQEKVAAARAGDITAWDSCYLEIEHAGLRAQPLHEELTALVLDVMDRSIQRPGRTKLKLDFLHHQWYRLVVMLKDQGMQPTRNDASDPHSGCDIVAEVVRDMGYPADYRNVKRVYNEINKKKKARLSQ